MYAPSTPCPVWMLGPCWAAAVVGLQALLHPLLCVELVLILAVCSAARAALGHTQSGVCGEGVGGNSRSPSFCFSSPCRAWLCLRTPFCSPVKQLQLSWLPGWLGEGVSPTQRVLPGLASSLSVGPWLTPARGLWLELEPSLAAGHLLPGALKGR